MNISSSANKPHRKAWAWIPSLYLFESIPFNIVILTSVVIYKTLGISTSSIAFWTSLLYLPWTIKMLWSPLVDCVSTKRNWVLATQFSISITLIFIGLSFQTNSFYAISISLFLAMAFLSASHDISADGFYILSLDHHQQAFFIGIRNTFYRLGKLLALGALSILAGYLVDFNGLKPSKIEVKAAITASAQIGKYSSNKSIPEKTTDLRLVCEPSFVEIPVWENGSSDSAIVYISLNSPLRNKQKIVATISKSEGSGEIDLAKKETGRFEFDCQNWNKPQKCKLVVDHNLKHEASTTFKISAGNVGLSWTVSVVALGVFLLLISVYHYFLLPYPNEKRNEKTRTSTAYKEVFASFFTKAGVFQAILFFLLYRLGEAQLVKATPVFLIDQRSAGGLGMTTSQFGIAYGTIGIICMTIGGIFGGLAAAKWGLKKMIQYMALGMNLPILLYVYMAFYQPLAGSVSIYAMIGLEEMGYGFGFTAYMLYMLHYVGESKFKTAEYAVGTSLMAIGMMLPGMLSGKMVELLGYQHFFIYVCACQIPGFICLRYLRIDPKFGTKTAGNN